MPIPMIIPPRNWLAAVRGLMMRPQSNAPSSRVTRGSPVTAFTRASQKMAPNECIDHCRASSGGGAVPSAEISSLPARSSRAT